MNDHIARLKREGTNFEVLINPDTAMAFRKGEGPIEDALLSEKIYSDAKKGELASENRLQAVFGTGDPVKIAAVIIRQGEVQVSAAYREEQREALRRQIVELVHRNGIDPRTNTPHPITRIENAFAQVKVKIDEHKSAEAQLDDVVKQLQPVLPIRFVTKKVQVIVPGRESSQGMQILKSYGTVVKSTWQPDSTLVAVIEFPGGLYEELVEKLNALTRGNVDIKEME